MYRTVVYVAGTLVVLVSNLELWTVQDIHVPRLPRPMQVLRHNISLGFVSERYKSKNECLESHLTFYHACIHIHA